MTNILMRNKANSYTSRVPKIQKARSIFPIRMSRKQTQLASYITPIFYQEVLPGDTWQINMNSFIRLQTQLTAPIDNLWVKTYFFFDPHRLQWENFPKQHGERKNPNDTIDYLTPTITFPNGIPYKSLGDYLGRTRCNIANTKMTSLGFRMYNRLINNYFRSERLQDSLYENDTDQDDVPENYSLFRIGKDRDYFTNCLPDLQLGEQVTLPLGTTAPVIGNGLAMGLTDGQQNYGLYNESATNGNVYTNTGIYGTNTGTHTNPSTPIQNANLSLGLTTDSTKSGLYADLSNAVSATISAMRLAIDTQEILERDNRNGTRYTEQLEGRYGCLNPDLLLYRPQYLGGTSTPLFTTPVVQTSGTGSTGQNTPQGNIAGFGTSTDGGEVVRASFGEFGAIMGVAVIKAIPQYQQGLGKCWQRMERYDYYYPEFNGLSDQAVKESEIFYTGVEENDEKVFGYTPRYDDYRMFNNEICGELRSEYPQSLDLWHYAEKFENAPQLNEEFIQDKTNEIIQRTIAVKKTDENGEEIDAEQFVCDYQFWGSVTRGMPSVAHPKTGGSIL